MAEISEESPPSPPSPPKNQALNKRISNYVRGRYRKLLGGAKVTKDSAFSPNSDQQPAPEPQHRTISGYLGLIAKLTSVTSASWHLLPVTDIFPETPSPEVYLYQDELMNTLLSLPNLTCLAFNGGRIPAWEPSPNQMKSLRILQINCESLSYTRAEIARVINFLIENCDKLSELQLRFHSTYWGPREFDGDPILGDILSSDATSNSDTTAGISAHMGKSQLKTLTVSGCNMTLTRNAAVHLQNLSCLEILDNECIRQQNFWDTIQAAGIELKSIKLNSMDPSYLDYLHSYSGLECLELSTRTSFRDWGDLRGQNMASIGGYSDHRAVKFYAAIEKHAETLEVLSIESYKEDLWCFGLHNASIIGKLQQLRILAIPIDSRMIVDTEAGLDVEDDVLCLFQQVSNHSSLETIQWYLAAETVDRQTRARRRILALGKELQQNSMLDGDCRRFRWKSIYVHEPSITSVAWQFIT
ncbi:hypothetical protein VKT23_009795 [Stygiomarasmius scandens]|uniref:RNI-like protein n=1 Tax=Marasmiellus scandens TaxID=2682957 RepID=A0ABR1JIM8_9AGAR